MCLGHFSTEDRAKVEEAIGHAMDAAVLMMQGEVDKAMNDYNSEKQVKQSICSNEY